MKDFLANVAADIINKYGTNLADIAIVFPNKRAALFMNEYFARLTNKPLWATSYITISELFAQQSSLVVSDNIKLICELHKVFTRCTQTNESLDAFFGWGQLLLSDFDDLDKNLADASKVFQNLSNIKEYDDITYLTDEQKQVLKQFFSSFTDNHNSVIKERFIKLWSKLEDIYTQFQSAITQQGITYEGHLYRSVIEQQSFVLSKKMYLFVGFNLLHKTEEKLFEYLMKEQKACFYWDFDYYYMDKTEPEAGYYIKKYLSVFPNELDNKEDTIYNNWAKNKDITYLSSSTKNLQTRYISDWLRANNRIEAGKRTVIVLCDETLLPNVLHSLPPEVDKVNITMGFPLHHAQVSLLVQSLFDLYQIGKISGTNGFRLNFVNKVLMHPYIKNLSEKADLLYTYLQKNHIYYPQFDQLKDEQNKQELLDDNLKFIFRNILNTTNNANLTLLEHIIEILKRVGKHTEIKKDPLAQESVFRMYTLLNRLKQLIENGDLVIETTTLRNLVNQLVRSTSIPFHGEPIEGIQIMGVLETRNLDFDNILMLCCNEGFMPKSVNDSSFIPYNIRKAYELTTKEHKIKIFAYYFYRLLQRASNISLTYTNSIQEGKTNEMSRFMLQLLVERPNSITKLSLKSEQGYKTKEKTPITKTNEVMKLLNNINKLSPTAINRYLSCPAKFYYNNVLGVKEPEESHEDVSDNRTFGIVFHKAMENIYEEYYKNHKWITEEEIDKLLKNEHLLLQNIDKAFATELFNIGKQSFKPQYNGLQQINRKVIFRYIQQVLKLDKKNAPFIIKGLELNVKKEICFETNKENKKLLLHGYIDRLDECGSDKQINEMRVIDYKTGSFKDKAPTNLDEVFTRTNIHQKHSDYYLQAILYSGIIKNNKEYNPNNLPGSPHLLFILQSSKDDYNSALYFDKKKEDGGKTFLKDEPNLYPDFEEKLKEVLAEMYNPHVPFNITEDSKTCEYCPYLSLCKREKEESKN